MNREAWFWIYKTIKFYHTLFICGQYQFSINQFTYLWTIRQIYNVYRSKRERKSINCCHHIGLYIKEKDPSIGCIKLFAFFRWWTEPSFENLIHIIYKD